MDERISLVNAIIDNLCRRSGFDAAFDVDEDILESIKQEMVDAIDAHLTHPAQAVDVEGLKAMKSSTEHQVEMLMARAVVSGAIVPDALPNAPMALKDIVKLLVNSYPVVAIVREMNKQAPGLCGALHFTRAIGNAQAEGWTRAGTLNVQRWKGIDSMINTDFDYVSDLPDGTYQLFTPTPPTQATPNAHE